MKTISRIEKETRKRKILVVDDEFVNRSILGNMLENDFELLYASNGKEALDIIRSEYKTLSIILLDLLMPEMDGYQLLEILSNDENNYKNIPVIILTSEKSAEIKSLQLGAVDFIPKPYDIPEVIKERIRRSIKLAEENKLITAVENDSVTSLYNKEFFYQYAKDMDTFHSDMQTDTAVINVNRFHLVNELYGRQAGNGLLRAIADSLTKLLRKIMGLACRCDSDTFFLYIAHQEDYDKCISELLNSISKLSGLSNISVRIGIYENCSKELSLEQRIDHAMLACNNCRSTYNSSFAFFDDKLREKEIFYEKLVHSTDDALDEKQFIVYYQPKFNIKGDKPVLSSAEALIRWKHPEHGMISPGVFIPLFEKNGLIQKIDHYVWREAAARIAEWKKSFGITLPVSVNVSRVDLFDPELEARLLALTEENGISPGDLMLEITESAYSDDDSGIISVINKLREDGFTIEMDDFGSGYSSLNMLTSMPIDILKLDMGFVRKMCSSETDRQMVGIILEIAKFLYVPVIAEGVEDEQQYRTLKNMGCDLIQGFYFSKPLPPEDFENVISKSLQAL